MLNALNGDRALVKLRQTVSASYPLTSGCYLLIAVSISGLQVALSLRITTAVHTSATLNSILITSTAWFVSSHGFIRTQYGVTILLKSDTGFEPKLFILPSST